MEADYKRANPAEPEPAGTVGSFVDDLTAMPTYPGIVAPLLRVISPILQVYGIELNYTKSEVIARDIDDMQEKGDIEELVLTRADGGVLLGIPVGSPGFIQEALERRALLQLAPRRALQRLSPRFSYPLLQISLSRGWTYHAGIVEHASLIAVLERFDGSILDAVMAAAGISRGPAQDTLATLPRAHAGLGILRVAGMHQEGLLITQRKLADNTVVGVPGLNRMVQQYALSLPPIQHGASQGLENVAGVPQALIEQLDYAELRAAVRKAQDKGYAQLLRDVHEQILGDGQPGAPARWAFVASGKGEPGRATKAFMDAGMFFYSAQYCSGPAMAALVRAALGQNPFPSPLAHQSPQVCRCGHTRPFRHDPGHALSCRQYVWHHKKRHDVAVGLVEHFLRRVDPTAKIQLNPAVNAERGHHAADVLFDSGQVRFLIDVTVANPMAWDAVQHEADSTMYNPDAATAAAQRRKEQHYDRLMGDQQVQQRHVVAFSVDATGRLGAAARDFLGLWTTEPGARAQLKKDIARALAVYAGRTFEAAAAGAVDGVGLAGSDARVPAPPPADHGAGARARHRARYDALRRDIRGEAQGGARAGAVKTRLCGYGS